MPFACRGHNTPGSGRHSSMLKSGELIAYGLLAGGVSRLSSGEYPESTLLRGCNQIVFRNVHVNALGLDCMLSAVEAVPPFPFGVVIRY